MAKISIKPSQARNAVQQEAALASRLQSLESQVRSIRNGLRYKIAAREHIKSQLKAAEDQIRLELSGNICRCGTYARHVKAIMEAAEEMRGGK